ncbi:MAG: transketolase C-terminal domain-containing protein, partial [Chloroflexota bacterium]
AVRTEIGFGSPNKHGSHRAHGAALGPGEVRLTKEAYGWDPDREFHVPDAVATLMRRAVARGEAHVREWSSRLLRYAAAYPAEAAELDRRVRRELRPGWSAALEVCPPGQDLATRQAGQRALAALCGPVPELFGGSADLSESNLCDIKGGGVFSAAEPGRNLRFGVREHAMGGIVNGVAYHGGFIPYAATFLTFSDYLRGAIRLAALSRLQVIYIFTHDSIGLGEDGPTHQPIEHLAALRAIPGLWVVRPGDANEATAAWALAVERRDGPVALALSRQKLPTLAGTGVLAREGVARGGYVLRPARGEADGRPPDLVLIATGSELHLAVAAADTLEGRDIAARVVSLPCWERFAAQDAAYRALVLPPAVAARVSIEAGCTLGWERWVGAAGASIGIDRFGASAPGQVVLEHFGFSIDHVAEVGARAVSGQTGQ